MPTTSTRPVAAALALAAMLALPAASTAQEDPVAQAVGYLGGEEALTGLSGIAIDAGGTRQAIDEGPTSGRCRARRRPYESKVTIDIAGDRMRLDNVISTPGVRHHRPGGQRGHHGRRRLHRRSGQQLRATWHSADADRPARVDPAPPAAPEPPPAPPRGAGRPVARHRRRRCRVDGVAHHAFEVADGATPITLVVDAETGQPVQAMTMESDPLRRDVEVVVSYGDWSATRSRSPARSRSPTTGSSSRTRRARSRPTRRSTRLRSRHPRASSPRPIHRSSSAGTSTTSTCRISPASASPPTGR